MEEYVLLIFLSVCFFVALIHTIFPNISWKLRFYFSKQVGDAPPLFVIITRITGIICLIALGVFIINTLSLMGILK